MSKMIAIVPARGGSKSVKMKNLALLAGRPLMGHVIEAAKRSDVFDAIYCSTDHADIGAFAKAQGLHVLHRPAHLATDDASILDVLKFHIAEQDFASRDFLFLLQPTSPFLSSEVIREARDLILADASCDGLQTVADIPHNHHAFNQRVVEDNYVRFQFPEERARYYNKQTKPHFFAFGNLVATQVATIVEHNQVFPRRCLALKIPRAYALDVDGPEDFTLAEYLLSSQNVCLPWVSY